MSFHGWKLSCIARHAFDLLFQRLADIDRNLIIKANDGTRFELQTKVHLSFNHMDRKTVKHIVPLRKPRIEDRRVRDLHGLKMVRRSHRGFISEAYNHLRSISPKLFGQSDAFFKSIHQSSIGEVEDLSHLDPQHFGSRNRFSPSDIR